jgi:hypothetical protein
MRMTPRQRDIIFKIADGNLETLPILYHFVNYKRGNEIFNWLLSNRFTGNQLIALVNQKFGNKLMDAAKFILMKVDKETEVKPIFLGKDFIPG